MYSSNLISSLSTVHIGLIVATTVVSIAGCSAVSPIHTVAGTVTVQGQPLKSGAVSYLSSSGKVKMAPVSSGGTYTIDLEQGDYAVAIQPAPSDQGGQSIQDQFATVQNTNVVPSQFLDFSTSGLTFKVKPDSENTHNITL